MTIIFIKSFIRKEVNMERAVKKILEFTLLLWAKKIFASILGETGGELCNG